jgi:hypothetical protein
MRANRRCWLLVLVPLLLTGPLLPDGYWKVRGWAGGESFYAGLPTSYWAAELDRWDVGLT